MMGVLERCEIGCGLGYHVISSVRFVMEKCGISY